MSEEIIKQKTGNKAPTQMLSKLRGQQAAMYKLKGFTYDEVLRKINEESVEKGWGSIGMSQLHKDIARHINYLLPYDANEMREVQEGEKMMYLAELDRNYNMLYTMVVQAVSYYNQEKKIKEKEKLTGKIEENPIINRSGLAYYIELLIKMGEHLAKIKGWEKIGGVNIAIQNNNNEFSLHQRANEELGKIDAETAREVKTFLDSLVWENKQRNGFEPIQGSDDKSIAGGK